MAENLEVKFAEQIKESTRNLEASIAELQEAQEKGVKAEAIAELKSALDAEVKKNEELTTKMQEQLDAVSTKLKKAETNNESAGDLLRSAIKENFDTIKNVRKGNTVSVDGISTKAVGNMTLSASLTGDQPRSYSDMVAVVPNQLVNVADLLPTPVTIEGGTYTFPRESGSEGSISTQTEGSDKSQIDYDLTMVDVNTDFIAGFAVYSKKMANNLPFLESFLPDALRRDYWKAENSAFNTVLAAGVTASTQAITGQNKIEMLIAEMATLEAANFMPNAIVVSPADYYNILVTEKSTGAGYGLPGVVTLINGNLAVNGVPVVKVNWMAANKYYVGDFSRVKKVITEGLSVEFSNSDEDNFRKNNITARVEAQVGLAIERTDAIIYGDFTAT